MNISAMSKRETPYDRARKEQVRRRAEMDLVCPICGTGNRPGAVVIDIDECDDARCGQCGDVWQVRIAYEEG